MGPQTWKDILQNKPAGGPEQSRGHNWQPTGSSGGKKFFIRRLQEGFQSAKVDTTQRVIYYKCSKCGISAKKHVGEGGIVPDSWEYQNLTCDEVIIKDIID